MFSPRPISWRIAGMPAGVAGTFTIRLGRSTAAHSRSASADCGVGIVSQIGRAFQTDIAVTAVRLLVDRTQHIGARHEYRQSPSARRLRKCCGRPCAWNCFSASAYSSLSPIAFSKIEGFEVTPFNSVALDERAQFALLDQAALQIVQPWRLAACFELLQLVHDTFSLAWDAASSRRTPLRHESECFIASVPRLQRRCPANGHGRGELWSHDRRRLVRDGRLGNY